MTDRRLELADDPLEQAAAWDARLRLPGASLQDRAAFLEWCDSDPRNPAAFDELQSALSTLGSASGSPELRSIRDAALEAVDRRWQWSRLAAAAALILALTGVIWLALQGRPETRAEPAPVASAETYRPTGRDLVYSTATGERSTVTLEDGSRVTLNTASRISVALSGARRDIILLAGQALFEVARDPGRPFVVRAGDKTITAIGTTFDVRVRSRGVQVTLLEGRVRVASVRQSGPPLPLAELLPGQRLLAGVGSGPETQLLSVDSERETSWRDGRVFFEDQPLTEAAAEMNRYSAIKLIVDPSLAEIRINGMFRAGQQASFARAIEAYLPIAMERPREDRILLRRRS